MNRLAALAWLVALPPLLGATPIPAPEKIEAGKKVFTSKCARCHKPYHPRDYSVDDWTKWMAKMKEKAHLTDEQFEQLAAWADSTRTAKPRP